MQGVYQYGSTSAFPNPSFQGSNYWVDVVFIDTIPPTKPGFSPAKVFKAKHTPAQPSGVSVDDVFGPAPSTAPAANPFTDDEPF